VTNVERYALFVDAGYLYAAGGQLCCGTKRRNQLLLNYQAAVSFLQHLCSERSGLTPLRVYWYDAATDAQPTPSHVAVASIEGVQLRLGRLTPQGQSGVDSRIVRDLIVLSHHRAIAEAFLLSGDDELREGVAEAQEMGVRVTLIGVGPLQGLQYQAPTLVGTADATVVLGQGDLTPFLTLRFPPAAAAPPPLAAEHYGAHV
jgi:uncharacterized LabA/DUF88 family protein